MPLDFIAASDALFEKMKPEDLAAAIGCSVSSVKQARMREGGGRRSPPPGWEAALARLARQKAAQLEKLAAGLA
jgi:hypothetical protein